MPCSSQGHPFGLEKTYIFSSGSFTINLFLWVLFLWSMNWLHKKIFYIFVRELQTAPPNCYTRLPQSLIKLAIFSPLTKCGLFDGPLNVITVNKILIHSICVWYIANKRISKMSRTQSIISQVLFQVLCSIWGTICESCLDFNWIGLEWGP